VLFLLIINGLHFYNNTKRLYDIKGNTACIFQHPGIGSMMTTNLQNVKFALRAVSIVAIALLNLFLFLGN
jgi:hypothetical protein